MHLQVSLKTTRYELGLSWFTVVEQKARDGNLYRKESAELSGSWGLKIRQLQPQRTSCCILTREDYKAQ